MSRRSPARVVPAKHDANLNNNTEETRCSNRPRISISCEGKESASSRRWEAKSGLDYNTHDPGITILEALCYAITDLAYRVGWDIKDILTPRTVPPATSPPYPNQAFFTAREILTVNPTTSDDCRRLLIDLQAVRNAWVFCKECACDVTYYAWCAKDEVGNDQLLLSYQLPTDATFSSKEVWPRGMYDALLELEADPELGDLNDRKVELTSTFHDTEGAHTRLIELRLPDLEISNGDEWQQFLGNNDAFSGKKVHRSR